MTKKPIFLTLIGLLMFSVVSVAQVKVGDNPGTINANSVLEVESVNKGLLLPRVALTSTTAVAPLTAHIAGMTVYNTATAGNVVPGYYYNDGTQWVQIATASAANAWKITGNAGTAPGSNTLGAATDGNFWGTTDAQNLIVGTNSTKRMLFDQRGNAYGGTNTAVTSTTSVNSFAWGNGNTVGGDNSATFGLTNSNQSKNSLVFGNGNTLDDGLSLSSKRSNRGTILGGGGNVVSGGENYNSIINGSQNTITGTNFESIITGFQTTVTNSQKVVVSGQGHTVTNATGSAVFGNFNATSATHTLIAGAGNAVAAGSDYGVALGENNAIAANHLNSMAIGRKVTTTATNQFASNYSGGYKFFSTTGPTSATTANVVILPDGKVGIGTEAPGIFSLDVVGTTDGNVAARIWNKSTGANAATTLTFGNDANQYGAYIFKSGSGYTGALGANNFVFSNASGDLLFLPGANEKMRVTAAGVGIGTTTPTATLHVVGTTLATAWTTTSDARLKTNIVALGQGALHKVMQLKPVSYDKKETLESTVFTKKEMGFIAQDLRKIFPTVVQENGKDKLLSVNYTALIPVLTKAIQEQQAQIEALKQQNQTLQVKADQIEDLRAEMASLKKLLTTGKVEPATAGK